MVNDLRQRVIEDPDLGVDVLNIQRLLSARMANMLGDRMVDLNELKGISECLSVLSKFDRSFINANRVNFYDQLFKAGYDDATIRTIGFLRDY